MRRRIATLAAVSVFALALGASPVFADSRGDNHADHWVVSRETTPLTGMSVACGANTYTVTSGVENFVVRLKGTLDANGIATTDGQAIETWTLDGVRVVDQNGRSHHVTAFTQFESSWAPGANLGADLGPWTSGSKIQRLRVEGTRDGFFLTARLLKNGTERVESSGTCPNLWAG